MSSPNYLYYIAFCSIMVFSPGPMTMLLMSISTTNGFKKTMLAQLGATSAYFISLVLFSIGLTALLQQYNFILKVIQYLGVLYILYLSWKQWQNGQIISLDNNTNPTKIIVNQGRLFWDGLVTGISNPKTIIMFSTVIPQFAKHSATKIFDLTILSIIFLSLQFLSGITYSYFGERIKILLQKQKYRKNIYRFMSIMLVIVAIMLVKA